MIIGIGIDIVEIGRFREAMERHGARMRTRFFTAEEAAYCERLPNPASNFAARFAAKEAFAKALGRGIAEGIQWTDVEVVRSSAGRPAIVLHRRALEIYRELGGTNIVLSLTHSRTVAAATVAIEGRG